MASCDVVVAVQLFSALENMYWMFCVGMTEAIHRESLTAQPALHPKSFQHEIEVLVVGRDLPELHFLKRQKS